MRFNRLKAGLSYRREAFRQRFSVKARAWFLVGSLLVIIFLGSFVVFMFERAVNPDIDTYGDAIWLTFVTITTVGYGDSFPVTAGGRAAVVVILGTGIGMVGIFISTRAAMRVQELQRRAKGLDNYVKSQGHYLVCGWNNRGRYTLDRLVAELSGERTQVVLLCDLQERPYEDEYVFFVRGSAVREGDLRRANVTKARAAILLADESAGADPGEVDSKTVLAALTIRALNPEIKITAEMLEPENVHHLELAGVGEILDSNVISGNLLAQSAVHYGVIGMVTGLITRQAGEEIYRLPVTPELAGPGGERAAELVLKEHGARILAVLHEGRLVVYRPDLTFEQGDILLVVSSAPPP